MDPDRFEYAGLPRNDAAPGLRPARGNGRSRGYPRPAKETRPRVRSLAPGEEPPTLTDLARREQAGHRASLARREQRAASRGLTVAGGLAGVENTSVFMRQRPSRWN